MQTNTLTITNDTEFYGFLNDLDVINAGKIAEILRSEADSEIYENDTQKNVVEEVVRRKGVIFTGLEAKKIAPWTIVHTQFYFARFEYLENETRPVDTAFADYDWVLLNGIQYRYAKYLKDKLEKGELKIT